MKYRDVVTFLSGLIFLLALAYTLGVDKSFWFLPVVLFIFFILIFYKLYVEK